MIGEKFPSELKTFLDEKSGLSITQLTQNGINYHMYFTDNAFDQGNEKIYMLSNRADGGEVFNIFELDTVTGEMTQLSDEAGGITTDGFTKTPDSELIGYVENGNTIKVIATKTGEITTVYEDPEMVVHNLSFSCDKKQIGFIRDEKADVLPNGGPNYAGFRDKMYAIKKGIIAKVNLDGTGFQNMFRDTCWINHFQYSPVNPNLAMFCHEGPWNEIHQRIWLIDMRNGEVWPCFRQGADDCVGHEFWLRNGDIVFDNRRGGHDGTISVTKEQCFAKDAPVSGEPPYFGFADASGAVYKTVEMPYYCNHYMSNEDASLFVGDNVEDIVLISPDMDGKHAGIRILANHNTTWKYQRSHCHPTFSWDGKKVLYSADTDDQHCNLFLVAVPEK